MKRYAVSLLLFFSAITCLAQSEKPVEEAPAGSNPIGYASVSEALVALKAKAGVSVTITKPDGWTIVNQTSPAFAIWSFTPEGHYAHPAVVRRALRETDGKVEVITTALCEADKLSCDRLMREFQQLTEQSRQRR